MKAKAVIPIVTAVVALVIGVVIGRLGGNAESVHEHNSEAMIDASRWTCSMHPQIQLTQSGKCPICGMDLIPVTSTTDDEDLTTRQIKLSASAMQLAEVELAPVQRQIPTVEIRMSGKIDFDESRLSYITAWIPGRLERLFVDYTGIRVNAGDHLVDLYSPELLEAQEELIQAIQQANALEQSESPLVKERAQKTIVSTREKLTKWGLSPEQILNIETEGAPSDHLTINAPVGGIVVNKNAVEGMYVTTGTRIYTIADLDHVWVKLDAYESNLAWLHYGQEVEFETEAYRGRKFTGRISFIDPTLDPKSRTVKVRVNVPNEDGLLKPEMFVRAIVHSQIASGGKVMDADLAGKWIGPMHPEIIQDGPGPCPICGMDLVSAESLGYLPAGVNNDEAPLVIPATAPLITGTRAIVYVALPDRPGVFEGREITLGSRAGEFYIVQDGLAEGELVATKGNFKIDSAAQLQAKPSMMSFQGDIENEAHEHNHLVGIPQQTWESPIEFKSQINEVVTGYLELQFALSHDDFEAAKSSATDLRQRLQDVNIALLEGEAHMVWEQHLSSIQSGVQTIESSTEIKTAREGFDKISEGMIAATKAFGINRESPLFIFHCPMAFDGEGADWIQAKQGTENPYYGSVMFTCGDEIGIINP